MAWACSEGDSSAGSVVVDLFSESELSVLVSGSEAPSPETIASGAESSEFVKVELLSEEVLACS